jgi:beta-lactam-binding protein with PASTA domain
VHGMSLQDAQDLLTQKGFEFDRTTLPVNAPKVTVGNVVGTIPGAGEQEPRGTVIQIQVATGNVVVPDVAGLDCKAATAKMKQKTLVATCQDSSSDQPQGLAYDSSPKGGTLAAQNSTVTILISSGPQQVTVPPVVGLDKNDAIHSLHDVGLKATIQQAVECLDSTLNNRVKSQDPGAGSQVAQGSSVIIVVIKFRPSDPSCVSPPPT